MGVPQGTILGPTSFTSYLSDTSLKVVIALLILYADDSTAIITGKTQEIANLKSAQVNNQFTNFASDNLLTVNASKTQILQIHTHHKHNLTPPNLKITDTSIDIVESSKLLGVKISDTMNWATQCNAVASKLRSVTYQFTIGKPLTCIINQSFEQGKFPENLKLSIITPLFKKDEKDNPANYRPISITSPISKVLEKAFSTRLEKHLNENKIIADNQHGFRKGKSTVTALFDLVSVVYDSLENREKINLILYDFSNAFGCLLPQLLVKKLERHGLDGQALTWISSFLTNRTQMVQLKSFENNTEIITRSDVTNCSMGVPQGTILGPVGFSIYDNDLPLKVALACLYLYADDSSLVVKAKNYPELFSKTEISNQNVINFAKDNYLRLNAKKTNLLQIHTAQAKKLENSTIQVNGENIFETKTAKLLGIQFTDTLSWKTHCDEVVSKLKSTAYRFSVLRATLTLPSLLKVYYADVQSHILYTILIWGGSPHLEQIFVAQKRCVRAMAGKRYWRGPAALDSCKPLFQEFKILTVYSLYILECAKFVKLNPQKFSNNSEHSDINLRTTRNTQHENTDLYIKPTRNTQFAQNPSIMLARIWNHLPENLKAIESEKLFVKKLKIVLLKYMFYDMHEFFSCKFD